MKTRVALGIVPLTDCAPVVVADELGFFAEAGLEVEISREPSWANIRDKVAVGALDGAQMLATMPLSLTLGLGALREPTVAVMALNHGGNTVTLAEPLCRRMEAQGGLTPKALKAVLDEDRAAGAAPPAFAMVYPVSPHHLELRAWLAAGGIDPDRDVRLIVVPPPRMVEHLAVGAVAGFCVGEPWGSLADAQGLGRVVATSDDIFPHRVEKVLGVTQAFATSHPRTVNALIRALTRACQWCDANRDELARLLARPEHLGVPEAVLRRGLAPAGLVTFATSNIPEPSQAVRLLAQMRRWGQVGETDDHALAARVFRPDLFHAATPAPALQETTP